MTYLKKKTTHPARFPSYIIYIFKDLTLSLSLSTAFCQDIRHKCSIMSAPMFDGQTMSNPHLSSVQNPLTPLYTSWLRTAFLQVMMIIR